MTAPRSDLRAVSESAGVATLVIITVVATATVGLGALLLNEEETEFGAEFSFSHLTERGELLVFYENGQDLRAGNIIISGPNGEVTWAELKGIGANESVTPSREPTRIGSETAYDASVTEEHYIEIRYRPTEEDDIDEPVVLAQWNEQAREEDEDDGFGDGAGGGDGPGGGGDGPGGGDSAPDIHTVGERNQPLMLQTG